MALRNMKEKASRPPLKPVGFTLFRATIVGATVLCCLWLGLPQASSQAQVPPITSSGLSTVVTTTGNVHDITGGTRPGGGANLFHSFGEFNVPNGNIANFLNDSGLATSNILGRVTGGNISNIFGTIQTTGFGGANLFLMNPAGFLFGPNATVNVSGMVAFTSADYLRLGDGTLFNAIPNAAADALLSTAPVAAYGFLGSDPGAITVQGSQLSVTPGQSISLVGGDITIQSGVLDDGVTVQPARLTAPGGQINLVSVASPGEVLNTRFSFGPNSSGAEFTSLGTISLTDNAVVDVSGDSSGTVKIRGGELIVENSTVMADTGDVDGAPVAIDIDVTGNVFLSNTEIPALAARTFGAGNAGSILISSGSLDASFGTADGSLSLIDSHSMGSGNGGNVTITTGPLTMNGDPSAPGYFIDSGSGDEGNGGNVSITAGDIQISSAGINTGDNAFFGFGSGGDLSITAHSLLLNTVSFATDSFNARAGAISFETEGKLHIMGNSFVSSISLLGDNPIAIKADQVIIEQTSRFLAGTAFETGGDITVNARTIELRDSSSFSTQTFGDGHAGNITLTATESVKFLDEPLSLGPSGLFTTSIGDPDLGINGNAGNVTVITPRLEMTNGARINTTTLTAGRGGDVTIMASQEVKIAGERPFDVPEEIFDLGGTRASGIYTRTAGSELCGGTCGDAGNVLIATKSLVLRNGALIDSGTTNNGQGGTIDISASNNMSISGTLLDGTPGGIFSRSAGTDPDAGTGGNISLTAGQSVRISDGAVVSSSSTGPGNTGNIQINAGNQFTMTNSSVTTEANQASGGAIKITTSPNGTVQLTNSMISASVLDGAGGGGSVNIDPQSVILQNSQILAKAVFGSGGNISITTNLLLTDATSAISASSQFGQNGTITIQSPNAPAGGKILPLSQKPLIATALLSQRCAALAGGEFSSFTVAGRDSLPAEPDSWLSSPLAILNAPRTGQEAKGGGETPLLSLRQIAPPGFLIQAFAGDWSSGCTS